MAKLDYVDAATARAIVDRKDKVVLLQFSAEWCGPCRQMSPMLEDIQAEMKENLEVLKVNIDKDEAFAESYSVRGIPHFVVVKEGITAGRLVGSVSRSRFVAFLEKYM